MLKLIGAGILIFSSGMAGMTVARGYAQRPRQLRFLQHALQMLETEIIYGLTPLPRALERVAQRCDRSIAPIFTKARLNLMDGSGSTVGEAWHKGLAEVYQEMALSKGDQGILEALGSSLGLSDKEDQQKHLKLAVEQLKQETVKAEEAAKKNVKLWNYLGFLGGLALTVAFL